MHFPIHFDSTMFSEFVKCPRAFEYKYIHNVVLWRNAQTGIDGPIHLSLGSALALAVETMQKAVYVEGDTDKDSVIAKGILAGFESFGLRNDHETKNTYSLVEAIICYYETWPMLVEEMRPLVVNGVPQIEVPFAQGLEIAHPDNGTELIFTGTADTIMEYAGSIYIKDDKTCSQLGPNWAKQWELRGQFTGYVWAMQQMGFPVVGSIIRGICFTKKNREEPKSNPQYSNYHAKK